MGGHGDAVDFLVSVGRMATLSNLHKVPLNWNILLSPALSIVSILLLLQGSSQIPLLGTLLGCSWS